jgi:hypothetical protein
LGVEKSYVNSNQKQKKVHLHPRQQLQLPFPTELSQSRCISITSAPTPALRLSRRPSSAVCRPKTFKLLSRLLLLLRVAAASSSSGARAVVVARPPQNGAPNTPRRWAVLLPSSGLHVVDLSSRSGRLCTFCGFLAIRGLDWRVCFAGCGFTKIK